MGAMRVLLLTHSYAPEISPPQRRWDSFVYIMRRSGWDVCVVTPRTGNPINRVSLRNRLISNEFGSHGERIRSYLSIRKPRDIPGKIIKHAFDGLMMFPRAFFQPRPDVVIATVPALPTMFIGFAIAKSFRRPLIIEMRDAWPDLISDSRILRWRLMTRLAHLAVRMVQRRATLVVTVTDGFAEVLLRDGVSAVRTIHNGISIRNFEPLQVTSRNDDNKLHALYLGNLGESHGLESIIKASTLMGDSVELRIVGGGTASARLRRYAEDIHAKVTFAPPARGDQLRAHYQWADTCIVSLRDDWKSFDHTVPSKIYELLSLSKHITGIVKGEAAEIITNVRAGDIVNHDPKHIAALWVQLAADPLRVVVGTEGRDWVFEKASLEMLGEKYVDLIRCVARQGTVREKH